VKDLHNVREKNLLEERRFALQDNEEFEEALGSQKEP
jgi:hypothetical protein